MFLNRKCFMTYTEDRFQLSRKMSEANFASSVLNREIAISNVIIDNDNVFITSLKKDEALKLENAYKDKYKKLNYKLATDAQISNKEMHNALQKAKINSLLDTIFYK